MAGKNIKLIISGIIGVATIFFLGYLTWASFEKAKELTNWQSIILFVLCLIFFVLVQIIYLFILRKDNLDSY